MKKKIILFLSVLMMAMFFTGCGARELPHGKAEEYWSRMDKLANEIVAYGPAVIKSSSTRFMIEEYDEANAKLTLVADCRGYDHYLYGEYKISDKTAERVYSYSEEYSSKEISINNFGETLFYIMIIIFIIILVLSLG